MAEVTPVAAINNYYGVKNGGPKVTLEEMKAFTTDEKRAFATEIVAVTGDTLTPPATPKS